MALTQCIMIFFFNFPEAVEFFNYLFVFISFFPDFLGLFRFICNLSNFYGICGNCE